VRAVNLRLKVDLSYTEVLKVSLKAEADAQVRPHEPRQLLDLNSSDRRCDSVPHKLEIARF